MLLEYQEKEGGSFEPPLFSVKSCSNVALCYKLYRQSKILSKSFGLAPLSQNIRKNFFALIKLLYLSIPPYSAWPWLSF